MSITKEQVLKTGQEMILEAFEENGLLFQEFLNGDYSKASYSHSPRLHLKPTSKDQNLQEKVLKAINATGLNERAILGIGSCIMLNAKYVEEGKVNREQFMKGIIQKVKKEIGHRQQIIAMQENNNGMFNDTNITAIATGSKVSAYSFGT